MGAPTLSPAPAFQAAGLDEVTGGKSSRSLRWPALQSSPHVALEASQGLGLRTALSPCAGGEGGAPGEEADPGVGGRESAGVPIRTEEAVVLSGALHAAVG